MGFLSEEKKSYFSNVADYFFLLIIPKIILNSNEGIGFI